MSPELLEYLSESLDKIASLPEESFAGFMHRLGGTLKARRAWAAMRVANKLDGYAHKLEVPEEIPAVVQDYAQRVAQTPTIAKIPLKAPPMRLPG